jgi:hypothetical protein
MPFIALLMAPGLMTGVGVRSWLNRFGSSAQTFNQIYTRLRIPGLFSFHLTEKPPAPPYLAFAVRRTNKGTKDKELPAIRGARRLASEVKQQPR